MFSYSSWFAFWAHQGQARVLGGERAFKGLALFDPAGPRGPTRPWHMSPAPDIRSSKIMDLQYRRAASLQGRMLSQGRQGRPGLPGRPGK